MKKVMMVAAAVAGMSAFAGLDSTPDAIEKFQLTYKSISGESTKIETSKWAGMVFTIGDQTETYLWDTKAKKESFKYLFPGDKKDKKINGFMIAGASPFAIVGEQFSSDGKKCGKGFDALGFSGYGTGKATSVAGNAVSVAKHAYGTWKLAADKSSMKLVGKGYTIADILAKNKVEVEPDL